MRTWLPGFHPQVFKRSAISRIASGCSPVCIAGPPNNQRFSLALCAPAVFSSTSYLSASSASVTFAPSSRWITAERSRLLNTHFLARPRQ